MSHLPFTQWLAAVGLGDRRLDGYEEQLSRLSCMDVPKKPDPPGARNRRERRAWESRIRAWRRIESKALERMREVHEKLCAIDSEAVRA